MPRCWARTTRWPSPSRSRLCGRPCGLSCLRNRSAKRAAGFSSSDQHANGKASSLQWSYPVRYGGKGKQRCGNTSPGRPLATTETTKVKPTGLPRCFPAPYIGDGLRCPAIMTTTTMAASLQQRITFQYSHHILSCEKKRVHSNLFFLSSATRIVCSQTVKAVVW